MLAPIAAEDTVVAVEELVEAEVVLVEVLGTGVARARVRRKERIRVVKCMAVIGWLIVWVLRRTMNVGELYT